MASLKRVEPDSFITLLVDNQTDVDCKREIEKIRRYVSEYIIVPVEDGFPAIARSRYIKTSMRKYVEGDFLYVDADTVWNAPIEKSDFTHDIMGVLDGHCLLANHPMKKGIEEDFRKVGFNPEVEKYVNGGVLFSKDSDVSREFFDLWHETWRKTSAGRYFIDMPSLNYAIKQMGNSFALLPDSYNVQISRSWEYFPHAKLIHFFTGWRNDCFESPYLFQKNSFWEEVQQNGISEPVYVAINNPLMSFEKTLGVYGQDERKFRNTALYGFVLDIYNKRDQKKTFSLLERLINKLSTLWN
jgi:hypothetical protein